jgi:hypothetical protein
MAFTIPLILGAIYVSHLKEYIQQVPAIFHKDFPFLHNRKDGRKSVHDLESGNTSERDLGKASEIPGTSIYGSMERVVCVQRRK